MASPASVVAARRLCRARETADRAVIREVLEETGVVAEIEGLIAVRSRVLPNENSVYLVFLLRAMSLETRPDGAEALAARFFTRAELDALPDVTPMTRLLIERVFAAGAHPLAPTTVPHIQMMSSSCSREGEVGGKTPPTSRWHLSTAGKCPPAQLA